MTKKIINTEQFVEKSLKFHKDKFDYSKCIYINDKTKVEIICKEHGSFMAFPTSHIKYNTGGCILCASNFQYTNEEFIKKAKLFHNSKYDYSNTKYISNNINIKIICPTHGEFEQTPTNHFKHGCLACSNKEIKSKEDFILESKIVHCNKFDYSEVDYKGMFTKVKILCKQHGEFNQIPANHLYGRKGCSKCPKKVYKNETLWLDTIELPNDVDHRNVYIKIGDIKYFVNGFDPKSKHIYQYNDDYWYGNLSIYKPEDIHPDIKLSFQILWDKAELNRKFLETAGYKVISIWESDFIKSQKDKTKIIIHNNKYGQYLTTDNKSFNKLKNFLSFKTVGVEYTAAYKNGWNGITYLLDKNGYFLVGLLSKVIKFTEDNNIPVTIVDKSKANNIVNESIDLSEKLNKLNFVPRNYQLKIINKAIANNKGIIRACTGSGKAQPLDAKILTPSGWINMGDVKKDSFVIGSDGLSKRVIEIFPQGKKEIYKVCFSDGTSTECCDDHLWKTKTFNEERVNNNIGSVKTLKQIKDSLFRYDGHLNHSIPMIKPVNFEKTSVLIDPYLLGVILCEGSISQQGVIITTINEDIIECCKTKLDKSLEVVKIKEYNFHIRNIDKKQFKNNSLIKNLKHYNLIGKLSYNKFIPKDYLFNSVEVRVAILQGLMDTNGTCSKNGHSCVFYSTSNELVKNVKFIVESLGGKAVVKNKQTHYKNIKLKERPSFVVHISMPSEILPFKIQRKLSVFKSKTKYIPNRMISKIEYVGIKEAQCILIDSDDHLYATDNFILTHNTLCTALITAKLNKPTIIYVIGLDLLKQFYDLFSLLFDEKIGFIGNGVCDIQRINIASIWTISSALKIKGPLLQDDDTEDKEIKPNETQSSKIINMLQDTRLHIFDESHVVTTETIKQIFNKINPENIYGFSGTPFRDDGSDLLINSILGDQIVNVPASELIADGYLAQPIIKFVKIPKLFIDGGTTNYQNVYKEYITNNIIRNNKIIENTIELLTKNYQVLVLFKHLQHGNNLRELLDNKNIKYEYLSGSDSLDKRLEVKNNLLSHKSNLVLASSIFDIGVDISSLSALVLAGGGKSSIRTLQRVGRVIRKYKNKKFAAIVDFYDDVRFLKNHSKKRYEIYNSESGFKLIIPKSIVDFK